MNTAVHTESLRCVQDARHFSNPTRNERSECRVGYGTGMRSCVSETHYYLSTPLFLMVLLKYQFLTSFLCGEL